MFVCCQVCSGACKKCGQACGDCCSKCNDACSECCQKCDECCDQICPEDKPNPMFAIFTLLINLATIITAAVFMGKDSGVSCTAPGGKTTAYYSLIIVVSVINVIFAFYLYRKFTEVIWSGETSCGAAGKILGYDLGVYFYFWVIIFIAVWMGVGFSMVSEETACLNMKDGVIVMVILWACYLGIGFWVLMLSICCTCCHEDELRAAHQRKINEGHYQGNELDRTAASAARPNNATTTSSNNVYPSTRTAQQQQRTNTNDEDATGVAIVRGAVTAAAGLIGALFATANSNNNNNNNNNTTSSSSTAQYQQPQQASRPPAQYADNRTQYYSSTPAQQQHPQATIYTVNTTTTSSNNNATAGGAPRFQQPQYV